MNFKMLPRISMTTLLLGMMIARDFFVAGFAVHVTKTSSSNTQVVECSNERTSRIAIVGAGAVGSYYGGRIWESVRSSNRTDVFFQLRNEHYDYCTKNGILVITIQLKSDPFVCGSAQRFFFSCSHPPLYTSVNAGVSTCKPHRSRYMDSIEVSGFGKVLHVKYLRLLCEDYLDHAHRMQILTVTNRLLNNHITTSCLKRKVTPHGHHVRRHFTSTASTSSIA